MNIEDKTVEIKGQAILSKDVEGPKIISRKGLFLYGKIVEEIIRKLGIYQGEEIDYTLTIRKK